MSRWLLAPVVMLSVPAWAGRAELDLDTRKMQVGQSVTLAVRIIDEVPTMVPRIEAPPGLQVDYRASSQSLQFVNGRSTMSQEYLYRLTALTEGTWTLGPVEVEVASGQLLTAPVEVSVVAQVPASSEEPLWVESELTPAELWEGQMAVYSFALLARERVLRSDWTHPALDCFVQPQQGRTQHAEYVVSDPGGDIWVDRTWVPLVATTPCERKMPGAVATARFSRITQRRGRRDPLMLFPEVDTKVVPGPSTDLRVRPLPPAPADFSGLVGEFVVSGELPGDPVQVGQSIDWPVRVAGDGSLEGFTLPALPDVSGLRAYDGTPRVAGELDDGRWRARAEITRVLVPTAQGTLTVPDLTLVTFSPSRGEYVRHTLPGRTLTVAPGAAGEAEVDLESFLAELPEGALPEAVEAEPLVRPLRASGAAARLVGPWYWALLGLMVLPGGVPLLQEGVTSLRAWWRRRQGPVQVREATPLERLDQLPAEGEARLAAIDAAVRAALAAHAGVSVAELDRDAVLATLPEDLAEELRGLTRTLDRARFAGAGADDPATTARRLIEALGRSRAA